MELLKGTFTVPSDVPAQRVLERRKEYFRKYVESFELEGWRLVSQIGLYKNRVPDAGDIQQGVTRWMILAYWDRMPERQVTEVDEKHIPELLKTGKFQLV